MPAARSIPQPGGGVAYQITAPTHRPYPPQQRATARRSRHELMVTTPSHRHRTTVVRPRKTTHGGTAGHGLTTHRGDCPHCWRVIEVNGLTKRYGARPVDNLSFTVRPDTSPGSSDRTGPARPRRCGSSRPGRATAGTTTVGGVPFHRYRRGLRHAGALLDAQQVHGGRSATAHLWPWPAATASHGDGSTRCWTRSA